MELQPEPSAVLVAHRVFCRRYPKTVRLAVRVLLAAGLLEPLLAEARHPDPVSSRLRSCDRTWV